MKKQFLSLVFVALISHPFFGQTLPDLIPFLKGKKFGYVDASGKMIIQPKFNNAYPFGYSHDYSTYPGFALVQIGKTMFLVDKNANLMKESDFSKKNESPYLPPPQVEELRLFSYEIFEKDGKKGIQDENKNIILEAIYSEIDLHSFRDSYYDEASKTIRKPTFAITRKDDKEVMVRVDKLKIYDDIFLSSFSENSNHMIVWVAKDGKTINNGVLLEDRLILVDPKFTRIHKYYEDSGLMNVDQVVGEHPVSFYIDSTGKSYFQP